MGSQGYNKKKMEERFRVTENNNREWLNKNNKIIQEEYRRKTHSSSNNISN